MNGERTTRLASDTPEAAASPARSFQDLIVWQKAHRFVLGVYKLSSDFPKAELFGLTSQLRRAAVSVPANIAEGFGRRGRSDKAHFMNIAEASLEECRYYLILTRDLGYAQTDSLLMQLGEVSKLIVAYANSIRANANQPSGR